MAHKIHHFKNKSIVEGDIKITLNMDRFSEQFNQAQYVLDGMVMTSMVPFMPMETGTLINLTRARSAAMQGTGEVCAAAPPYGRFLYMGKVMVDELTGSPWARKEAKKITTDRNLSFSKAANPKATDHWFDAAKEADGDKWIKSAKEIAGGG